MVKPLIPEVTVEDARRLFGIGTDQFLISWLDTTWEQIRKQKGIPVTRAEEYVSFWMGE
jgi:hypothetical protein